MDNIPVVVNEHELRTQTRMVICTLAIIFFLFLFVSIREKDEIIHHTALSDRQTINSIVEENCEVLSKIKTNGPVLGTHIQVINRASIPPIGYFIILDKDNRAYKIGIRNCDITRIRTGVSILVKLPLELSIKQIIIVSDSLNPNISNLRECIVMIRRHESVVWRYSELLSADKYNEIRVMRDKFRYTLPIEKLKHVKCKERYLFNKL